MLKGQKVSQHFTYVAHTNLRAHGETRTSEIRRKYFKIYFHIDYITLRSIQFKILDDGVDKQSHSNRKRVSICLFLRVK